VCRFLADEPEGSVLATGDLTPCQTNLFFAHIARVTRVALKSDRRSPLNDLIAEWEWPQEDNGIGSFRALSLSFWPSESVNVVAVVFREGSDAAFGMMYFAVAKLLYPVLARYVQLWWLHRQERNRANAYQTALDIADVGVILLDRRLEVSFTNALANSILAQSSGLIQQGRQLTAERDDDGLSLQAALQHARHFNVAKRHPGQTQRAVLIALKRGQTKRALMVTVLGLERSAIDVLDPAVIIYVLDPSRDLRDLLTPLCNIYQLTNAESRLSYFLVTGLTLRDAAAAMKIRDATARSYLKQIFSKTSTNRQADLVRLMLTSLQRLNERRSPHIPPHSGATISIV